MSDSRELAGDLRELAAEIDGGVEGSPAPEELEIIAANSEAAVEIAEIEAGRDVELAEINAQTSLAITETMAEAETGLETRIAEVEAWQEAHGPADHAGIWTAIAVMETTLLSISEQLTSMQTPPENTPQDQSENPPSEGGDGEDGRQNDEQQPAPEPRQEEALPVRKHRWI